MKIKDVILETGLTDRAIRLYIENGLISPSSKESYAGRKSISFAKEDVDRLKDIATLRKAGFSISEIKTVLTDNSKIKEVLSDVISRTSQTITENSIILKKLQLVIEIEDPDITSICNSLISATDEKKVPTEDTDFSLSEKIEKTVFTAVAVIFFILTAAIVIYNSFFVKAYLYPTIKDFPRFIYTFALPVIINVLFSISLLYRHRKKIKKIPKLKRISLSLIMSAVMVFSFLFSGYFTFYNFFMPNTCSETKNPANYLVLDDYINGNDIIKEFFP